MDNKRFYSPEILGGKLFALKQYFDCNIFLASSVKSVTPLEKMLDTDL